MAAFRRGLDGRAAAVAGRIASAADPPCVADALYLVCLALRGRGDVLVAGERYREALASFRADSTCLRVSDAWRGYSCKDGLGALAAAGIFYRPLHHAVPRCSTECAILPFGSSGDSLAWQIDADFRFTVAGGYFNIMPKSEANSGPFITRLFHGHAGPDFGRGLLAYCRRNQVDFILIGPGTPAGETAAIGALGWPARLDCHVWVVRVP